MNDSFGILDDRRGVVTCLLRPRCLISDSWVTHEYLV